MEKFLVVKTSEVETFYAVYAQTKEKAAEISNNSDPVEVIEGDVFSISVLDEDKAYEKKLEKIIDLVDTPSDCDMFDTKTNSFIKFDG